LTLWEEDAKSKMCKEATDAVNSKFSDPSVASNEGISSPCAYLISYVYSKYQKYTTTVIENVFDILS
jgi:hypothetical protein